MASNGIRVLEFIFFCVVCIIPIGGRGLGKHEDVETNIQVESPMQATEASDDDQYSTHYAGYSVNDGIYHGLKAEMSVWEITDVKPKSYSSAYISASNYEQDRGEMIAAGVHVYPSLYRNYDLRFFTYWTTDDGVSTGCYNYYCPGFVIANNSNLHPGQALAKPLSSYDNDTRYITIRIKKDEQTGDWSLYREDQGGPIGGTTLLGWWPKTLFKGLADYATKIEWAGEVDYLSDELGPSMGSGHFSGEDEGKAAYFDDIVGFDSIGLRFTPLVKDVSSETDKEECYDVSDWRVRSFFHGGSYFYYGGPGGCT